MKNILVPVDFSRYSIHALEVAHQIARKTGGEIHLLHILEAPTTQLFNSMGILDFDVKEDIYYAELKRVVTDKIDEIANRKSFSDVRIIPEIEIGKTYDHITDHISKHKADLVVMGTRGSSGLEELFIGSNTEKVVRKAGCPVLSVPGPIDIASMDSLVFATSLEDNDSSIIQTIATMQNIFGMKLYIIHINTVHVIENEESIFERLTQYISRFELKNCEVHVQKGITVEEGIMAFTENVGADMIALSTHGRSGLAHFFSGSLSESMVNHSKKMVLSQCLDK